LKERELLLNKINTDRNTIHTLNDLVEYIKKTQITCSYKLIVLFIFVLLKKKSNRIETNILVNAFIKFYKIRATSKLRVESSYCNPLQQGNFSKVYTLLKRNPIRILIKRKILSNFNRLNNNITQLLKENREIILQQLEKRIIDYFTGRVGDRPIETLKALKNWKHYLIEATQNEISQFKTNNVKDLTLFKDEHKMLVKKENEKSEGVSTPVLSIEDQLKRQFDELKKEQKTIEDSMKEEPKIQRFIFCESVEDYLISFLINNGPSYTADLVNYIATSIGRSKSTISQIIIRCLGHKTITRSEPFEGQKPKFYIWYLEEQIDDYNFQIQSAEENILQVLKTQKVSRLKKISDTLKKPRYFIKAILSRLIVSGRVQKTEFDYIINYKGKIIPTITSVYYLPKFKQFALQKIELFKSGRRKQKRLQRITYICDLIIRFLPFEVPRIVRNYTIKLVNNLNISMGAGYFTVIGASLLLTFEHFNLPIDIKIITDAVTFAEEYERWKDEILNSGSTLHVKEVKLIEEGKLDEINAILLKNTTEKIFYRTRRNIRKIIKKLRRDGTCGYKKFTGKDYLRFAVMIFDLPFHTYILSEELLQKAEIEGYFSGKDPYAFVGAIIYYIQKNISEKYYTQRILSQKLQKTEVSIRKNLRVIEELKFNIGSIITKAIINTYASCNYNNLSLITSQKKINLYASDTSFIPLKDKFIIFPTLKELNDAVHDLILQKEPNLSDGETIIDQLDKSSEDNSVIFLFQNSIIDKILNGDITIIFTTNSYTPNLTPEKSQVFICQNSIDKNLKVTFTPKFIITNLPLVSAINYVELAGMTKLEFYIQFRYVDSVNLISIDSDTVKEHSIALFDILQDLEIVRFQRSIVIPIIDEQPLYNHFIPFIILNFYWNYFFFNFFLLSE